MQKQLETGHTLYQQWRKAFLQGIVHLFLYILYYFAYPQRGM